MYVVRSPERDRIAAALRDAASAARRTTTPLHLQPVYRGPHRGEPARDRARRARRSPSRSGRGSRRRSRSRSWPRSARRSAWERTHEARQPPRLWQVAADAGLVARLVSWPSRSASTRACRRVTTSSSGSTSSSPSSRSSSPSSSSSASTTTGGATSPSGTCGGRSSPSRRLGCRRRPYLWIPIPAGLPRGIIAIDWMFTLGFVVGARVLARTLMEPGAARPRRAQRGADRRRRRRRAIVIREMLKSPQLGYTPIGLVDDDARQEEHAAPRHPRAGHDAGAARGSWPTTAPTRSSSPSRPATARSASVVNACRDAGCR